jgi:thiamine-phosphate pyrophosphorylase
VTLSPIYATASKPGYGPALGPAAIAASRSAGLPVVALGGIGSGAVAACREAGAAGIAIMGGLMRAGDPAGAARAHLTAWSAAGPADM